MGVAVGGLSTAPATADEVVYGVLSLENGVVVYRASPGLVNDQYVNWGNFGGEPHPPSFMGDDDLGTTVDPSCGESQSIYVACENGGSAPQVVVYLGDGDDRGSSGNDHGLGKSVTQYGEAGDDDLSGDMSTDTLLGGPGNDQLTVDGTGILGSLAISNGDVVSGGDGIDTLQLARLHQRAHPGHSRRGRR